MRHHIPARLQKPSQTHRWGIDRLGCGSVNPDITVLIAATEKNPLIRQKYAYAFCSWREDSFQSTQTHSLTRLSLKIRKTVNTSAWLWVRPGPPKNQCLRYHLAICFFPRVPRGLHALEASITYFALILQSFQHECYRLSESRTFLLDISSSSEIQAVDLSNREIPLSALTAELLKRREERFLIVHLRKQGKQRDTWGWKRAPNNILPLLEPLASWF